MKRKLNNKQKLYHFVGFPFLTFIILYIIGFFVGDGLPEYWEISGPTFGISVVYWIELFYPPKPPKDSDEPETSLKEDVKKYTVNGSPFNRLMVIIYSLIILLTVGAYVFSG